MGSIVHATGIALSRDCAPVPRDLEIARSRDCAPVLRNLEIVWWPRSALRRRVRSGSAVGPQWVRSGSAAGPQWVRSPPASRPQYFRSPPTAGPHYSRVCYFCEFFFFFFLWKKNLIHIQNTAVHHTTVDKKLIQSKYNKREQRLLQCLPNSNKVFPL